MAIEQANAESVFKAIDAIRRENFRALSNIFLSSSELCDIFEKKECFYLQNEKAIFIMIPYHNTYYDILFTAIDEDSLRDIIDEFKLFYNRNWTIRTSIIGKEEYAESIANLFEKSGFYLGKKLARTIINIPQNNIKNSINSINSTCLKNDGKNNEELEGFNTSFAEHGDEKEILSLLLGEFDLCDDNIPELDMIIRNINKNQVAVIKRNKQIVGFQYFEIKNGKCNTLYDFIKKEYRGKFLLFLLIEFINKFFKENNIKINRNYGWRDTSNKRLMKFAILNNQIPDGVYIYNMKLNAKDEEIRKYIH